MASQKRSTTRFLRELDLENFLEFYLKYDIPQSVVLMPSDEDNLELGPNHIFLPILAVIEGGVRFPLHPFLCKFFHKLKLAPSQVTVNVFRIVMDIARLNEGKAKATPISYEDIFGCYTLGYSKDTKRYYLGRRPGRQALFGGLPDTDKYGHEYMKVSGSFEPVDTQHPIPRVDGKIRKFRFGLCTLLLFPFTASIGRSLF